jgi:uncharacterized membrane protein YheB (UPF0754 family)
MEWLSYILLPIIAAAIGWFTNWVAIKMLFHPRKKIRILFLDIQGIFPKRQYAMAEKIGKMVATELLNVSDFKERINDPKNLESINQNIEAKVDQYLDETFPAKYPMMSMLLGKKARLKMKGDFLKEVQSVTPVVIDKYMENLEGSFDVEKIVRQKVSLLSPITLENLIMEILKKEFQFIELIGAVLGFLIGVIQVLLVWVSKM